MKSFDREDYLSRQVPYRMRSISWFVHLLSGPVHWNDGRKMEVYVDGRLWIAGNHHAIANPSIEIGIIYSRALLEFLGLKADREKKRLVEVQKRKDDDVGVEDFSSGTGPLPRVRIADALACYKGPPEEAEQALVAIIAHADKGVAHLTEGPIQDDRTLALVELGSKGVLTLVCRHLYDRLGRPRPDYEIKD